VYWFQILLPSSILLVGTSIANWTVKDWNPRSVPLLGSSLSTKHIKGRPTMCEEVL